MDVTYFVLCFGDAVALANRCLSSIFKHVTVPRTIRVVLNEPSPKLQQTIDEFMAGGQLEAKNVYVSSVNIHKYPAMRRAFSDPDNPIVTPYVSWFDDDSYIRTTTENWGKRVLCAMDDSDMIGSLYKIKLVGGQHLWVADQPWYGQKAVTANQLVTFATGGWWCIRREILAKHDWPVPALDHRGGDVMLGELCRQQGYRLRHRPCGVAINANDAGQESRAPKRGFDSPPIGYNYKNSAASQVLHGTSPRVAARLSTTP